MKKILIVVGNYYPEISKELLVSAQSVIQNYKTDIIEAPGIFEIPILIAKNIENYDAAIALGCVIKGETPHFEYISNACTNGIMKISINTKKPIGNGILTCLNKDQAIARTNKGVEAAKAILQVMKNEFRN